MEMITNLIEQKILEAEARGEFKNLPGAGKPIQLDDDTFVPDEMKVAYRFLKNAGVLPQEVLIYQELQELRQQSSVAGLDEDQKQKLKLQLVQKEAEFNMFMERLRKK